MENDITFSVATTRIMPQFQVRVNDAFSNYEFQRKQRWIPNFGNASVITQQSKGKTEAKKERYRKAISIYIHIRDLERSWLKAQSLHGGREAPLLV